MEIVIKSVNELSAWMVPQLVMAALAGSLLILLAACWLRFFHAPSASTRHFIWLLAIAIPLCLPIASWLLPRWDLGPLAWSGLGSDHVTAPNHASPWRTTARAASTRTQSASVPAQRVGATVERSIRLSTSALVLAVWLAGVMIPMSRWIMGVISLRRLGLRACEPTLRACEPTAPLIHAQLDHAIAQLRISGPVRLLVSTQRAMPMQWGDCPPNCIASRRGDELEG